MQIYCKFSTFWAQIMYGLKCMHMSTKICVDNLNPMIKLEKILNKLNHMH